MLCCHHDQLRLLSDIIYKPLCCLIYLSVSVVMKPYVSADNYHSVYCVIVVII